MNEVVDEDFDLDAILDEWAGEAEEPFNDPNDWESL